MDYKKAGHPVPRILFLLWYLQVCLGSPRQLNWQENWGSVCNRVSLTSGVSVSPHQWVDSSFWSHGFSLASLLWNSIDGRWWLKYSSATLLNSCIPVCCVLCSHSYFPFTSCIQSIDRCYCTLVQYRQRRHSIGTEWWYLMDYFSRLRNIWCVYVWTAMKIGQHLETPTFMILFVSKDWIWLWVSFGLAEILIG